MQAGGACRARGGATPNQCILFGVMANCPSSAPWPRQGGAGGQPPPPAVPELGAGIQEAGDLLGRALKKLPSREQEMSCPRGTAHHVPTPTRQEHTKLLINPQRPEPRSRPWAPPASMKVKKPQGK